MREKARESESVCVYGRDRKNVREVFFLGLDDGLQTCPRGGLHSLAGSLAGLLARSGVGCLSVGRRTAFHVAKAFITIALHNALRSGAQPAVKCY